jgi:hypothetical protein
MPCLTKNKSSYFLIRYLGRSVMESEIFCVSLRWLFPASGNFLYRESSDYATYEQMKLHFCNVTVAHTLLRHLLVICGDALYTNTSNQNDTLPQDCLVQASISPLWRSIS